jgi:hypothetical protein
MSRGPSGESSGVGPLLDALEVPRLAAIGFSVGVVLTIATFVFFVVVPGDVRQAPLFYFGLAFVLALSLGLLFTIVLVTISAIRLIRSTDLSEYSSSEDLDDGRE